MSEWWTYRPSDFLMFSPRTYWRLIELHQLELWPWQLLALLAGAVLCGLALHGGARAASAGFGLMALAWLAVAWCFHLQRYASIHTAAPWFALAFAGQAALLAALALARPANDAGRPRLAAALLLAAVALYPLVGAAVGRPWAQAELFAVTPDPTALATLGLLLRWRPQAAAARWLWFAAWPWPLLWCAGSGLTLWNLQAPEAALLPAAAGLALAALVLRAVRAGSARRKAAMG